MLELSAVFMLLTLVVFAASFVALSAKLALTER